MLLITLISCDGRERAHKSNTDVLIENKLLDSFSESIKYIPETYSETITDTILSNGFKVKIKTYSDMNTSVLNEIKKDGIHYKEYHRNFNAHIMVFKNDIEIFNKTINKSFLLKQDDLTESDFEMTTLNSIWLDEMSSIQKDKIIIDVAFAKTDEVIGKTYKISIDSNGAYSVKEQIEEGYL